MPTLSFFLSLIPIAPLRSTPLKSLRPAMGVAHLDHHRQNTVPRLLFQHLGVGEHAAVPANMLAGLGDGALVVTQPIAGVMHDIELAVRIRRHAMAAGLVVR